MKTKYPFNRLTFLISFLAVVSLCSCSKVGMYSIILRSDVQFETEELNEIKNKIYHHKAVKFPSSVALMSENTRIQKLDAIHESAAIVHKVDTTIKMDLLSIPGQAIIKTSCKQGIAIAIHDHSELRKNGKLLDVQMRYVCMEDSIPTDNWASDGTYLITPIGNDICTSGFHSLEFMFYNTSTQNHKLAPELARVLYVCGKK